MFNTKTNQVTPLEICAEMLVLCKSNHPNIVQVLELGQFLADSTSFFIDMELCSVSLDKCIYTGALAQGLSVWDAEPSQICSIFKDIIRGLVFIHEHGEVHQDLSPHNGIPLPSFYS
jgi:serine/threonine protein kinase